MSDHTNNIAKGRDFAEESLKACSAKVWLAERGKEMGDCTHCSGEWSTPQDDVAEILNDRWEKDTNVNARYGRKAPYLTKIRIFGAFLNDLYDEFIPTKKRFRANEIHKVGWS